MDQKPWILFALDVDWFKTRH